MHVDSPLISVDFPCSTYSRSLRRSLSFAGSQRIQPPNSWVRCTTSSSVPAAIINHDLAGSGLGGVGLLNITLDWSNIGSTMIYYPWWTQLNMFASYVIAAWILIPIAYYKGLWNSDQYPIQSQTLYTRNGSTVSTILHILFIFPVFLTRRLLVSYCRAYERRLHAEYSSFRRDWPSDDVRAAPLGMYVTCRASITTSHSSISE